LLEKFCANLLEIVEALYCISGTSAQCTTPAQMHRKSCQLDSG
jgi:hypothetical protein